MDLGSLDRLRLYHLVLEIPSFSPLSHFKLSLENKEKMNRTMVD